MKLTKNADVLFGETLNIRDIFIWSHGRIYRPKSIGGLGLRSMRTLNAACMMKAGWSLCNCRNDMWDKVICTKYRCGVDIIPKVQAKRDSSKFWRRVCNSWEQVQENLTWRLGKGKNIQFWKDHWVPGYDILEKVALQSLPLGESYKYVAEYFDARRGWHFDRMQQYLPSPLLNKIRGLYGPNGNEEVDSITWKLTPDGSFSLASAVNFLQGLVDARDIKIFNVIWQWKGPERICLHLWKLASNGLLTNDIRAQHGLSSSGECNDLHQSAC